jgi:hypothetical protein
MQCNDMRLFAASSECKGLLVECGACQRRLRTNTSPDEPLSGEFGSTVRLDFCLYTCSLPYDGVAKGIEHTSRR